MSQADTGNTVRVHYKGTLDDGTEFDSSRDRDEPLEFTLGIDRMIPGFERAVIGMSTGECKTVRIPFSEAYGDFQEDLVRQFPRSDFPDHFEFEEGLILSADSSDGHRVRFKVLAFDDERVTLDGNHPLAGQNLTFEIELIEIL